MKRTPLAALLISVVALLGLPQTSTAQNPLDGTRLFEDNCATCHGSDGRGQDQALLGFETPLPDFTDCDFASREIDNDWHTIIHEGGPVRGFNRMMPSFGQALTDEEIDAILLHIRGFCRNKDWPRGELNLPRAIATEKAFPEDEAVISGNFVTAGNDAYSLDFIWEQRFGTRNQMEVSLPFQRADLGGGDGWISGVGDLAVGVKHVLTHSLERGSILTLGGEYLLATGDEQRGLGEGSNRFESYLAYGKILRNDSFVQLQGVTEFPVDNAFPNELVVRGAAGRSMNFGSPYGRTYTPMLEVEGKLEDLPGAEAEWSVIPQMQISLNTRQHIRASAGFRVPVTQRSERDVEFVFYLLWDWFDGGVLEGW